MDANDNSYIQNLLLYLYTPEIVGLLLSSQIFIYRINLIY